jgi:hypothetical protein
VTGAAGSGLARVLGPIESGQHLTSTMALSASMLTGKICCGCANRAGGGGVGTSVSDSKKNARGAERKGKGKRWWCLIFFKRRQRFIFRLEPN